MMDDLCRLCLKRCETFAMYITSQDGVQRELPKKILDCIAIEVTDNEPNLFSKLICSDCTIKLDFFHEFRENSRKSQEYFNELLLYYQQAPCTSAVVVIDDGMQQQQQHEHQHLEDSQHQQMLAEINFTGNEFILDETDKTQFNKDYDDLIQSLQKDDLNFSTNDEELVIKQQLEISIQGSSEQKHHPVEAPAPPEECFNSFEAIVDSIGIDAGDHSVVSADGLDYNDFEALETKIEASMKEMEVQDIMMDTVQERNLQLLAMIQAQEPQPSVSSTDSKPLTLAKQPEDEEPLPQSSFQQSPPPGPPTMAPTPLPPQPSTTNDTGVPLNDKTCEVCFKTFRSKQKLKVHRNTHLRLAPFKCNFEGCTKAFKSRIGLVEHVARHTNSFEYSCDICSKGFQNRSYLTAHRRAHSSERSFKCTICEQSFKSKQALLDHKNRHLGLKPFSCDQCGKQFTKNPLLQAHLQQHLVAAVRYACTECNKTFTSKSYLNVHRKIHRNERPFVCEVCKKAHLTRQELAVHMTSHTGEKPYVCEVCGMGFARRNAMYCHRRTHSKERPYSCDICGQTFTQYTPMRIHRKTHDVDGKDVALLRCTVPSCTKGFASKTALSAHMGTEHKGS